MADRSTTLRHEHPSTPQVHPNRSEASPTVTDPDLLSGLSGVDLPRLRALNLSRTAQVWLRTLLSQDGVLDTFEVARDLRPGAWPRLSHELHSAGLATVTADTITLAPGWTL